MKNNEPLYRNPLSEGELRRRAHRRSAWSLLLSAGAMLLCSIIINQPFLGVAAVMIFMVSICVALSA